MTHPTATVAWFEIATDDPDAAQHFYGTLFDWQVAPDDTDPTTDYRLVLSGSAGAPAGGIVGTRGTVPPHAVFSVAVPDVTQTCRAAERLGGQVVRETVGGVGPDNAYLRDPAGNLFGVFTPPPAS